MEECSTEQTGMVGASQEGQGPHRAVVPLMMMNYVDDYIFMVNIMNRLMKKSFDILFRPLFIE